MKFKKGDKKPVGAYKFPKGHKINLGRSGSGAGNWKGGISKNLYFYVARYRNKKRCVLGTHTVGEWENLKAQYNWTCPCCRKPEPEIKLTEDHIVPISKGGSDNIENIQPLCRSCNSKKNNILIIKYEK